MIKVLFVCLGNICRSPLAEGVFAHLIRQNNLHEQITCDSAGTSDYHVGHPADPRSIKIARNYGIELTHRARQFTSVDFNNFTYIIVMDNSNLANVRKVEQECHGHNCRVFLMREFDSDKSHDEVADPYWSDEAGFDECYQTVFRSSQGLLDFIRKKHNL